MSTVDTPRVRMTPERRREQLLDHGVRLLSTRSLDELSIEALAEEAGISRGLLYHYFGNKQEFHRAVVARAVDDLVAVTAPREGEDLVEILTESLEAYVDYVVANRVGYASLVRTAHGGDEHLRELYEQARSALTGRMFERAGETGIRSLGYDDTPATRLMVRGWASLAEEVVLGWANDPTAMSKDDLLASLAGSLFGALDAAT
ncbi:TetR family transcriptional regulator [Marmoricola endophyticus]|uniref:TetR family transcriptional regulator n=1 Tax=Marmoricola endophyticus TaxID=2040280 RepID=A0A917BD27_9ACTN|nr:TetR/AcrR family transcriptional regulator [Marmoricola endophyticus]GGF37035.1 TetR family transcriptional regulator [Marmoricola endophyticus]